jgi:hypothetical protein
MPHVFYGFIFFARRRFDCFVLAGVVVYAQRKIDLTDFPHNRSCIFELPYAYIFF